MHGHRRRRLVDRGFMNRALYSTRYTTEDGCNASGRNLTHLELTPWPCTWNASEAVQCTRVDCPYEDNAAEILWEFWTLTMAIMVSRGRRVGSGARLLRGVHR